MSHPSNKILTFNNGLTIPALGLGTWQSHPSEVYDAVLVALKNGYRHIDTAALYNNEEAIGQAIKDSGIPRDQLFITTKLWSSGHTDPAKDLDISLKKLQLDYVDLYLIHWPVALNPNGNDPNIPTLPNGYRDIIFEGWDITDTWAELQKLVANGKTKSIGVSNFTISNLQKILNSPKTTIIPAVNQVELHPYLPQHKLVAFAKEHGILTEAYSPLGSTDSPVLKDETVLSVASKYNTSPAKILISWALWRNTIVLPKSVTESRIIDNFQVVDLSDEDGEALNKIVERTGPQRLITQNWHPVVVFDSDE